MTRKTPKKRAKTSTKPLVPRARAFAERYPGPRGGIKTAGEVGYSGDSRTLSARAATLLADPRVQAILRARRERGEYSGPIGDERRYDPPDEAKVPAAPATIRTEAKTSEEYFRSIINDERVPLGERGRAAAQLRQIEKDRARELERGGDDKLAALRKKVAAIITKRSLPDSLRHLARRHPDHADRLEALATEVES